MVLGPARESGSQYSCLATQSVVSTRIGVYSLRITNKPDGGTTTIGHLPEDLVAVLENVPHLDSEPDRAVETRERFLADEVRLRDLDAALVSERLLNLRQGCSKLHRHRGCARDLGVVVGGGCWGKKKKGGIRIGEAR